MLLAEAPIRVQEVAREVARLARENLGSDVDVIWFGSWRRGQARPRSDIDIAVRASAPVRPEMFGRFREAVEELPTLYQIDLVDLNVAGSLLRGEIVRTGVRL